MHGYFFLSVDMPLPVMDKLCRAHSPRLLPTHFLAVGQEEKESLLETASNASSPFDHLSSTSRINESVYTVFVSFLPYSLFSVPHY